MYVYYFLFLNITNYLFNLSLKLKNFIYKANFSCVKLNDKIIFHGLNARNII